MSDASKQTDTSKIPGDPSSAASEPDSAAPGPAVAAKAADGPKPIAHKDAGEGLADLIGPLVQRTHTPRVIALGGELGGCFRLDYDESLFQKNYRQPVLVACRGGVGAKLKIALLADRLDTIGIDLVARNVNDLVCRGAEPLFFLDHLGPGRLEPPRMAEILKGISAGCLRAGAALLEGETAEMGDFCEQEAFDLAGFAVGVVDRRRIIDGSNVEVGDVAIALASDGVHGTGCGLARRVLLERAGYALGDRLAELGGASVGEELLRPTRIYVKPVLDMLGRYRVKRVVKAMAHITAGGLVGCLPRVLPAGLTVRVKRDAWEAPAIFKLIAAKGLVDDLEMWRVFNMGVGLVIVAASAFAGPIMNRLRSQGERCWVLGRVRKGGPGLTWA